MCNCAKNMISYKSQINLQSFVTDRKQNLQASELKFSKVNESTHGSYQNVVKPDLCTFSKKYTPYFA